MKQRVCFIWLWLFFQFYGEEVETMSKRDAMPVVTNKGAQEVKANFAQSAPKKGQVIKGGDLRTGGGKKK